MSRRLWKKGIYISILTTSLWETIKKYRRPYRLSSTLRRFHKIHRGKVSLSYNYECSTMSIFELMCIALSHWPAFYALDEITNKKYWNKLNAWLHATVNFSQIYSCRSYNIRFWKGAHNLSPISMADFHFMVRWIFISDRVFRWACKLQCQQNGQLKRLYTISILWRYGNIHRFCVLTHKHQGVINAAHLMIKIKMLESSSLDEDFLWKMTDKNWHKNCLCLNEICSKVIIEMIFCRRFVIKNAWFN